VVLADRDHSLRLTGIVLIDDELEEVLPSLLRIWRAPSWRRLQLLATRQACLHPELLQFVDGITFTAKTVHVGM
jgi:hypothetical protein